MSDLLQPARSPRIERLARDLAAGGSDRTDPAAGPGALEQFWKEVEADGAPLIEPGPTPDTRIVTFVWRAALPVDGVLVLVNTAVEAYRENLGPARMSQLDGTDLWWRSYLFPDDVRAGYQVLPLTDPADGGPDLTRTGDPREWMRMRLLGRADPLNPEHLPGAAPGVHTAVFALPRAPAQTWFDGPQRSDRQVELHTDDRPVWLHETPGPAPAGPRALLVILDGDLWAGPLRLADTLEHLHAQGELPALLTVMVGSARQAGAGPHAAPSFPERNRELADPQRSWAVLTEQVLPLVAEHRPITEDPDRRIIAGQSLGASLALRLALRPDTRFGRAALQSAAFAPDGGPFPAEITDAPAGLRVYQEIGRHEWRLLPGNRVVRAALADRGALAGYQEYGGGHDPACWRGGIAAALRALT